MGRLRAATLLLAVLAAGLLLAACGSSGNDELLPGTTASQIESNLDQVRASANEGNCEGAEDGVAEVSTEIEKLNKVDKELKKALKQGAAKLSEVVSTSCGVKEEEAEQAKAEQEQEVEEEEQATLEAEEEHTAEEEADEEKLKTEEREKKAKEKAEEHAEQPGPSEEAEETGPKGKAKGHEEEEIVPPAEEVTPPTEGGTAGGIGPGAEVEGGP